MIAPETAWATAPYLHGIAAPFLTEQVYAEMLKEWPAVSEFQPMGAGYHKHACSERYATAYYAHVLKTVPIWGWFYRVVKTPEFGAHWLAIARAAGAVFQGDSVSARFEFSSLPADGGYLAPHRDTKGKLITLVVPMVDPTYDWNPAWGGGTALLTPKDPTQALQDYGADWDAFDVIADVPYQANQALVFIRSEISWHGVKPLTGPKGRERRSLTINIEAVR
jgi:hypothetical protein